MKPHPKALADAYAEAAANPGVKIDIGDIVVCDDCNEEFTKSDRPGGLIVQSKAICPDCAPTWLASMKKHSEERHIRGRCPADMSFADFVRAYRGPGAGVTITTVRR